VQREQPCAEAHDETLGLIEPATDLAKPSAKSAGVGTDPVPAQPAVRRAPPTTWAVRGLFLVALVFLLKEAQPVLAPVLIALVLTFVLATPVRLMRRHGIPEYIGATILVGALLGAMAVMAAMLAGPATQWWERAPVALEQMVDEFDRLRASVPGLAPPAQPRATRNAPAQQRPDPIKEKIASEGVALTGAFLGRAISFALSAAATIILLFCLLASEHWMLSRTVEAIPRRRSRAALLIAVRNAQREIGTFIAALSVINLGVGIVTTAAMMLVGLPNPVLWGTVAGVLNFIPYIGPLIIVAMLSLAALVSFGATLAMLLPPAAFLLIHAIEANLVSPLFVSKRLSMSPVAVFLSVMFWGWLWGIAGAMIAVPLLVGIRSACRYRREMRLLGVYLHHKPHDPPSLASLLVPKRRRATAAASRGPS